MAIAPRRLTCVAVFAVAALAVGVTPAAAKPPNVIWVMADDMGWGEPGAYPCTSPHGRIKTPNLDIFAQQGLQFMQAYAGYTVCAPSRTTLFTGRHSGQFPKYGLPGTSLAPGQAKTTSGLLQQAGYTTAAFGKVAPLDSPMQQGFDAFTGQVSQGLCHNMYPEMIDTGNATRNLNLTLNWKPKNRELCMARPDDYNYTVDITHHRSIDWLDAHVGGAPSAGDAEPFFLYIAYTVPHAGGWGSAPAEPEQGAPVPTDGPYSNHSWPDVERDHASVITYLDNYVGELMAKVKALGIDEDT